MSRYIEKLNSIELETGMINSASWHDEFSDSAYIYVGGLPYELTEGDLLAVFSQYGEIEDIVLIKDKETGNSKGFCFICYQNQKSTVLAVDNFNGIQILGRTIKVSHSRYKFKEDENVEERRRGLKESY
jgi:RNA-binding motif X-linked protein 2